MIEIKSRYNHIDPNETYSAITVLALNGFDVIEIDEVGNKTEYPALNLRNIYSLLGDDVAEKLIASEMECHNFGYAWFDNIQAGDDDTIAETIGLFRSQC